VREKEKSATEKGGNFIRDIIEADIAAGKHQGRVGTRFPPEPNGYLHIGHCKAILINYGLARQFGGTFNLRFDDTNPTKEEVEYVEAIQKDIQWLGCEWDALYFASDYFEELYRIAEKLIEKDKAYVDSLNDEQIRQYRGNYYIKGKESPYRNRPISESLDLFRRMRAGEFPDGAHVLRAKIDLSSQNMNLRDPILYRIRHAHHHRTGDKWCIYPLYDYAHPLSDAIEKITYSLCSLEFESHRPLYDWCIREAEMFPSQQIEFAKLFVNYTIVSKRKLIQLVEKGIVNGWDDPRMPTIAGMRRRGFSPEALRNFVERVGVAKADSVVDFGLLEYCVREDLNAKSPRLMAVLKPLKLVIDNFPDGETRAIEAPLHPEDASHGTRKIPFSKVLYIEQDDFREDPPKDWFRLAPGREVRLRYACIVKCTDVKKDAQGNVVELHCTWDEATWGGNTPDGRQIRGTLHWVSAAHAKAGEARLYDRLFSVENPGADENRSFLDEINPHSLTVAQAMMEPHLLTLPPKTKVQFERLGYFVSDYDSTENKPIWNRTVTLKDSWAKLEAKASGKAPATAKAASAAPKAAAKDKAPPAAENAKTPLAEIGIEDFSKIDLRVGLVKEATLVEKADKLLRLIVDVGEDKPRQIFSGIRAMYPDPSVLVGKRVVVVANLKPRQMKFGLSEGMVLAGGDGVATTDKDARPGDKIS
jgi:glutaminyl-tRNA synthetase